MRKPVRLKKNLLGASIEKLFNPQSPFHTALIEKKLHSIPVYMVIHKQGKICIMKRET